MSTSGSKQPKKKPYSRGPSRVGSPEVEDTNAIVLAAFKEMKFQQKRINYIFSLPKGAECTRYVRTTIMPQEAMNTDNVYTLSKFFPLSHLHPSTLPKAKAMQIDPVTSPPQPFSSPTPSP